MKRGTPAEDVDTLADISMISMADNRDLEAVASSETDQEDQRGSAALMQQRGSTTAEGNRNAAVLKMSADEKALASGRSSGVRPDGACSGQIGHVIRVPLATLASTDSIMIPSMTVEGSPSSQSNVQARNTLHKPGEMSGKQDQSGRGLLSGKGKTLLPSATEEHAPSSQSNTQGRDTLHKLGGLLGKEGLSESPSEDANSTRAVKGTGRAQMLTTLVKASAAEQKGAGRQGGGMALPNFAGAKAPCTTPCDKKDGKSIDAIAIDDSDDDSWLG